MMYDQDIGHRVLLKMYGEKKYYILFFFFGFFLYVFNIIIYTKIYIIKQYIVKIKIFIFKNSIDLIPSPIQNIFFIIYISYTFLYMIK